MNKMILHNFAVLQCADRHVVGRFHVGVQNKTLSMPGSDWVAEGMFPYCAKCGAKRKEAAEEKKPELPEGAQVVSTRYGLCTFEGWDTQWWYARIRLQDDEIRIVHVDTLNVKQFDEESDD